MGEPLSSLRYYDRQGRPMSEGQWLREFSGDRHVRETFVGETRVSTIWLGLDHSFGIGRKPLIFETMMFPGDEQWRYTTEAEAIAHHDELVALLREVESVGQD